ncbi:hypothetical protein ACVW0K_007403 [Streptomyces filamentosus]
MVYLPYYAGEIVTADGLATRIVEVVMDWTPLASLGTFQNGFTANTAKVPKMRIERVMGDTRWLYEGRINNSAPTNIVNNTVAMFLFTSTAHRPTVEHGDEVYGASSGHYGVRLGLMTSGNLTASVPTGATSPTTIWLDDVCFTNPK